jgi:hypothetical protein
MSLQKEKGLAPQKKNLKPKRESEASAAEADKKRTSNGRAKAQPSKRPKDQR